MSQIDVEAYAAAAKPSADLVGEVGALTKRMVAAADEVEQLEAKLKDAKNRLRQLQCADLPQAMAQAGIKKLTTPDGWVVEIKDVIRAAIPKEYFDDAVGYLRAIGDGDMVKHEMKVQLGTGSDNVAAEIQGFLHDKYGVDAEFKASVHPSTLSAYVKEKLQAGADVPMEWFGVYQATEARIKRG